MNKIIHTLSILFLLTLIYVSNASAQGVGDNFGPRTQADTALTDSRPFVELVVKPTESFFSYTIKKDGRDIQTMPGNGAELIFVVSEPGFYYLIIETPTANIEHGIPVQVLDRRGESDVFYFSALNTVIYDENEQVIFTLSNSEMGVRYYLNKLGGELLDTASFLGTGGKVEFPYSPGPGAYTVYKVIATTVTGKKVVQEMNGEVEVILKDPNIHTYELSCSPGELIAKNFSVQFKLSGADSRIKYILRCDGGEVTTALGAMGKGQTFFSLGNLQNLSAGVYSAVAVDSNGVEYPMNGEIRLDWAAVTAYQLTSDRQRIAYLDQPITFTIDNYQIYVTYELLRDGEVVDTLQPTVQGLFMPNPLEITANYGPGIYTMRATRNEEDYFQMRGQIEVLYEESYGFMVPLTEEDTVITADRPSADLYLFDLRPECKYYLRKNARTYSKSISNTTSTVVTVTGAGLYSVEVYSSDNKFFLDDEVMVREEDWKIFDLTSDKTIIADDTEYINFTYSGSQPGTYYVLTCDNEPVIRQVMGDGSPIVARTRGAGGYRMWTISDKGVLIDPISDRIIVAPATDPVETFQIMADKAYIRNESENITFTLNGHQAGVKYELYRNGQAVEHSYGSDGLPVFTGAYGAGTYTIAAVRGVQKYLMDGEIEMVISNHGNTSQYYITPQSYISRNGTDLTIEIYLRSIEEVQLVENTLSNPFGSKLETSYVLDWVSVGSNERQYTFFINLKLGPNLSEELYMKNISFSTFTGDHSIPVKVPGSGDLIKYNVSEENLNGSVRIKLDGSQPDVNYMLLSPINEYTLTGTGGTLDFGTHSASGVYFIRASYEGRQEYMHGNVIKGINVNGENYIIETTYTGENYGNKVVNIIHYDRLGRPIQTMIPGTGSNIKGSVSFLFYDEMGRSQHKNYLPYATSMTNYFSLIANRYIEQQRYYAQKFPNDENLSTVSEQVFDKSPLGLVSFERRLDGSGRKHFYGKDYEYDKVFKYTLASDGVTLQCEDYYYPGTLSVHETFERDYDYLNKREHEEVRDITYTNAMGRVVAKRKAKFKYYFDGISIVGAPPIEQPEPGPPIFEPDPIRPPDNPDVYPIYKTFSLEWEHTIYYVYDDFGRLKYTIPVYINHAEYGKDRDPIEDFKPRALTSYPENQTEKFTLQSLSNIFHYTDYDKYGNVTKKYVPGSRPSYYIYDSRNRLIMSQSGYNNTQWSFVKYDVHDRPLITGVISGTTSYTTHKNNAVSNKNYYEKFDASKEHLYTNNCYPSINGAKINTVTYYDDYRWLDASGYGHTGLHFDNNFKIVTQKNISHGYGLVTGSKERVIGISTTQWLASANYYDKDFNSIQTVTQLYPNGTERVANAHDFVGRVIETRVMQTVGSIRPVITEYRKTFSYDRFGKLLNTTQQVLSDNSHNRVVLAAYEYDDIGQVSAKRQNDLTYNIEYIPHISGNNIGYYSDLFSYKLGVRGVKTRNLKPRDDGRLSYIVWGKKKSLDNGYKYDYDILGNLTDGIYVFKDDVPAVEIPIYPWPIEMFEPASSPIDDLAIVGFNYQEKNYFNEKNMTYDGHGNLKTLYRTDSDGFRKHQIKYRYDNPASAYQLTSITFESGKLHLFDPPVYTYRYDKGGNMIYDEYNGIEIEYNELELPARIFGSNSRIDYIYSGSGRKLAAKYSDGSLIYYNTVMTYQSAFGGEPELRQIHHQEGFAVPEGDKISYKFILADHLGSTRVMYSSSEVAGKLQLNEEQRTDYYPYGLAHSYDNLHLNRYLLSGKEIEDSKVGTHDMLGFYDFHARHYNPVLGRWFNIDPKLQFCNPYIYAGNTPNAMIDPDGEFAWLVVPLVAQVVSYVVNVAVSHGGFHNWDWASFGSQLVFSAVSAVGAYGIGTAFQAFGGAATGWLHLLKSVTHGVFQGGLTAIQGGKFMHGFGPSFVSSLAGPVLDGMPVGGQYALSGYIGGFTSHAMGGDFLKGAISAIIVHGFNHLLHGWPTQDFEEAKNQLIDYMIENDLREADIFKDLKGDWYLYDDPRNTQTRSYRRMVFQDSPIQGYPGQTFVDLDHGWNVVVEWYHGHGLWNVDGIGISKDLDIPVFLQSRGYNVKMGIIFVPNRGAYDLIYPSTNGYVPRSSWKPFYWFK